MMKEHTNKRNVKITPRLRTGEQESADGGAFFLACARAALLAMGIGLVLLLILCAVCLSLDDPSRYAPYFSYAAVFPAALLCGLLAASATHGKGLLSGVVGGGIFTLTLWLLSLLPVCERMGNGGLAGSLLFSAVCMLLSCIGGYLMTHRKPKVHRPARR